MRKLVKSKWLYFSLILIMLFFFRYCSTKGRIQSMTSIDLPFLIKTVEIIDSEEGTIESKFILPASSVQSFISENYLTQMKFDNSFDFPASFLSKENEPILSNEELFYYKEDCQGLYNWKIFLKESTGELWVMVGYPDIAGDHYPCNK